ncbi:hypothetical protein AgCh_005080 [Apium graveolens]
MGFRKIDPEQWEFANDEFIRGKTHLLAKIHRRKPVHSHSAQPGMLSDSERQEFEEEIAKLYDEANRNQHLTFEEDNQDTMSKLIEN